MTLSIIPRRSVGASARSAAVGFTLIELLVTISIIAVLLGIVLPVYPRVRDASRKAACAANLHGIAQGFEIYRNDHKQTFPSARALPPPWLSGDTDPPLNVAMAGYIEAAEAWRCPGDPILFDFPYTDEAGVERTSGMSYDYRSDLSGLTFDQSRYARFGLTQNLVSLVGDADGDTFETQDGELVTVDFFHQRRNVLFTDGHIE